MTSGLKLFQTDRRDIYCFADSVELCERLLDAGAGIIQLREKTLDDDAFRQLAKEMVHRVNQVENAVLIINDRVDIAIEVRAHGIHVGQGDEDVKGVISRVPDHMIIGVSVGNVREAREAKQAGADYVGAGAIFPTATKSDADIIGLDGLRSIVAGCDVPVVAIGGITRENISQVRNAGAHYFAMISEVNHTDDISARLGELQTMIR